MQKEDIKFQNSTVFEGMTSIRAVIRSIDTGISKRRIEKIIYAKDKLKKISKEVSYFKAVSEKYGFELCESTSEEIDKLTLGTSHGGIIALASDRPLPPLSCDWIRPDGFYVMLEGVEDPYNFGYSLRSLYALGCSGVVLSKRNWLSAAGVVCRSSAGASELMSFSVAENSLECAKIFKEAGYKIVSADENTDNTLGECELKLPICLIVGGEKRGISRALLDMTDMLVKIPYSREFNASLSTASAATIFAYDVMRQNKK